MSVQVGDEIPKWQKNTLILNITPNIPKPKHQESLFTICMQLRSLHNSVIVNTQPSILFLCKQYCNSRVVRNIIVFWWQLWNVHDLPDETWKKSQHRTFSEDQCLYLQLFTKVADYEYDASWTWFTILL